MSRIAEEATMGLGHIYRYFKNKEAIMLALAEREFGEFMLHITQVAHPPTLNAEILIDHLLNRIPWLLEYDRSSLALDVLAEAGRHPKFEEAVARVDQQFRRAMRKIIEPAMRGLTEDEIEACVEILLVMTRALAVHAGTHPVMDSEAVVSGYKIAMTSILARPKSTPSAYLGTADNDRIGSPPD